MEESYSGSPWSSVEARSGETLSSLILRKAEQHGHKEAFVDAASGDSLTYAGFVEAVRNSCAGLMKHGIKKGDVVLVFLPNSIYYPVIYHSILRLGAVATTCIPLYKKNEFLHQYKVSQAQFLVTSSELVDSVHAMFEDEPDRKPKVTFVLGEETAGCVSFFSLMTTAAPCWPEVDIQPDDLASMPFSSGTTGASKGVCHSQGSLLYAALDGLSAEMGFLQPHDSVLDILPLSHQFGIRSFLLVAMVHGMRLIVMDWYKLQPFLETVQKYKVDKVLLTPPVLVHLVKDHLARQYDLSSLRTIICSGAPLSQNLVQQAKVLYPNMQIREGFGMTEVNLVTLMPENVEKPGSVGRPLPNVEIKVVSLETGKVCPPGELGEMYIRSPQIFTGYYNNQQASHESREDGWFKSGDLVRMDSEGYIYMEDRLKELIKYGGYQVPPAELEALLLQHPLVLDVAVIGVPDEEVGEIPKAFIVRAPDSDLTADQVMKYVEENISPWRKIRLVEFVEAIPKSASGKILRRILRDKERQAIAGSLE